MKNVAWGSQGLEASIEGLGAMGMSAFYGARDDEESSATLHRALDLGVSLIDTAEMYGPFLNEQLIGRAIGDRAGEYALATKTGVEISDDGERGSTNGSPAYLRTALERSLRNLGRETIDLYYIHRIDPNVPIEETIGAMGEFVAEGKIRYVGVSEAAPETIRRAHKEHRITALQTEYSLWSRDPEDEILPTVRELGIGFVPYSPLGRGFLTGKFKSEADLAEGDFRKGSPRFSGENFARNLKLVELVEAIAAKNGVKASQVALAWVLAQGYDIVPIPGTKRVSYLEENVAAARVELSDADLEELGAAFHKDATAGTRYPEAGMKAVNL